MRASGCPRRHRAWVARTDLHKRPFPAGGHAASRFLLRLTSRATMKKMYWPSRVASSNTTKEPAFSKSGAAVLPTASVRSTSRTPRSKCGGRQVTTAGRLPGPPVGEARAVFPPRLEQPRSFPPSLSVNSATTRRSSGAIANSLMVATWTERTQLSPGPVHPLELMRTTAVDRPPVLRSTRPQILGPARVRPEPIADRWWGAPRSVRRSGSKRCATRRRAGLS